MSPDELPRISHGSRPGPAVNDVPESGSRCSVGATIVGTICIGGWRAPKPFLRVFVLATSTCLASSALVTPETLCWGVDGTRVPALPAKWPCAPNVSHLGCKLHASA